MSAAILQGVPGSTQDIDLWLDLSPRQYMRAMNLACSLGGQFVRNTVVELRDGTLVNFVYEVTGLGKFATEFHRAIMLSFHGQKVAVMPLESIQKSNGSHSPSQGFGSLGIHRRVAADETGEREGEMINWLPDMDLNHDKQIQSLLCYRYTIGQAGASANLESFFSQSSRQTFSEIVNRKS